MAWTTATTRATDFFMTAAIWNAEHVDNMNYLKEVNYTAFTGDVPISGTTVGTANQIVSSGAITYEAVPHLIECFLPRLTSAASVINFIVRDGSTVLGTLSQQNASVNAFGTTLAYRVTPTAASHTYNVAAWIASAGTWTVEAGTGGTAGDATTIVPGFIRIFRVPT
jgi:hypothetical protein